jgi:flagellar biosynthesis/type III secretory pathway chaperone
MTDEHIELSELDTLLDQERAFLLNGDLKGLGTLLPAKEKLVEILSEGDESHHEQIVPLEGKLQRNQLLLDGALEGIRSVAARLAALREVRTSLDTYDAQGRKKRVVTQVTQKLEKRA